VHLLRSAEWAGGPPMPAGGALFAGFYLNELLLKLLARQDAAPGACSTPMPTRCLALQGADDAGVQSRCVPSSCCCCARLGVLPELAVRR
jgi:DNA repair protein RecO (recombination protein O)